MGYSVEAGPTDRECWILAECIKTAARAADSAFCHNDGEREYGHGELVMTAKLLVEGGDGETVSSNQLENLLAIVELALKMKVNKKKAKARTAASRRQSVLPIL
jgi:hypothetical protein